MKSAFRRARGAGLAAALLAATLAGCAGAPREEDPFRRGLWPFYTADAHAFAGSREARALGPLLHWERRSEADLFELRPLYSSLAQKDELRRDVLFPLYAQRLDSAGEQSHLAWLARQRTPAHGVERERILGLWFDGRDEGGERYAGLFPLGGVFRHRLSFDRIEFALWPLYAHGERGDYRETQWLWPFFARGEGGRDSKWRLWPLYGVERRDGEYERRFWLWPFFHRRLERLDSDVPLRSFFAIPFFGRTRAGTRSLEFYLFPLYVRTRDEAQPGVGTTHVLWPIFSRSRARDGSESLSILPFWSRTHGPKGRRWSVLFGLLGHRHDRDSALESSEWRFGWVGRALSRREGERELEALDAWPFYRRRSESDPQRGSLGFARAPVLLPMRGLEPDGWNRHYNGLFELYGARWQGGELRSSWFFGLRELRRRPEVEWTSWGGVLHHRRARPVDPP